MDILRRIAYYMDPASGNLTSQSQSAQRAIVLLNDSYDEINRLTAELAEARELLQRVWNDEREWIGGRLCFAIEAAIGAGKGE
jgi:hypothetical protein